MKTLTIIIFTFVLPTLLFAQIECEFIKLCSQAEVDAFPQKYKHCNNIYYIEVDDNCNWVNNLDSLIGVTELGVLRIQRMDSLSSISGLNNLKKVGTLRMVQRRYFDPFPNLDTITHLDHFFAYFPSDLSLYANINHIDSSIGTRNDGYFLGLPSFTSDGLFSIGVTDNKYKNEIKNLVPDNSNQLEFLFVQQSENINLSGLDSIKHIKQINFNRNKNCDFSHIDNITSLSRYDIAVENHDDVKYGIFTKINHLNDLLIKDISNLKNINVLFPNIKKISSHLSLTENKHMVDIKLLDSFDLPGNQPLFQVFSQHRIVIQNNPFLADCVSPYICKALQVYPDSVLISGNGANCSKEELLPQCINSTGDENTHAEIRFYPNPVVDLVSWSSSISIDKIEVFNVSGQVVFKVKPIDSYMDISHLPPGVYTFHVYGQGFFNVQKMVKM